MPLGNDFLDKEAIRRQPTAVDGANRILQVAKQTLQNNARAAETIKSVVKRHTRAAIVAELEANEAQALQAFYVALKTFVTTVSNVEVDDLPA